MHIDKNEFLSEFREEAREYMERLNAGLLALEHDPTRNEDVKKMKKTVHNLKGAARIIEFKEIEDIAHSLECVLDAIESKCIAVTPELATALFICFDFLQILAECLVNGQHAEFDSRELSAELQKIAAAEVSPERFIQKYKMTLEKEKKEPDKKDGKLSNNNSGNIDSEDFFKVKSTKMNELLGIVSHITIDKIKIEASLKECRALLDTVRNYHKIVKCTVKETATQKQTDTQEIKSDVVLKGISDIEKQMYNYYKDYETIVNNVSLVIDKLQERSLRLRMLPLNNIFALFPRLVRDLALSYHKKIDLEIKGEETELDRKMIEIIKEPLIHLVRNAIDHGIEPEEERKEKGKSPHSRITLKAWQEGEYVLISVEDDGRGIDLEEVKAVALQQKISTAAEIEQMSPREIMYLVFRNGFTTSLEITKISGRGVGLDIVRDQVEQLKGEVILESQSGVGSTIVLRLPLTLSICTILLADAACSSYGIPITYVEQIVVVATKDVQISEGKKVISLGRRIVPLVNLAEIMGAPGANKVQETREKVSVIVVVYGRQRKGFIVDTVVSEQEVVVKSLGEYLGKIENIAGAAILGNGDIALILNVPDLMAAVNVKSYINASSLEQQPRVPPPPEKKNKSEKVHKVILLVEDSLTTREMERSILETVGYKVVMAMDGLSAIDQLVSQKIDLIITDIEMPRLDGIQLAHSIKQDVKYKDIPIIIVTAVESAEDKRRGIEAGADAYILKSEFDQTTLLQTVESLIG